jgi:hypothetical protein
LFNRLLSAVPAVSSPYVVAMAVEIRFTRQLSRIPDLMVVRSDEPARHWFYHARAAVRDRL